MTGTAQDNSLNDWFFWCHTHCRYTLHSYCKPSGLLYFQKLRPRCSGITIQTKHNTSIVNWFLLWSSVNIFTSCDSQNYLGNHLHILRADDNSPQRKMGPLFEFRGWIVGSKSVKTTKGRCLELCVVQKCNDSVPIHSYINCLAVNSHKYNIQQKRRT